MWTIERLGGGLRDRRKKYRITLVFVVFVCFGLSVIFIGHNKFNAKPQEEKYPQRPNSATINTTPSAIRPAQTSNVIDRVFTKISQVITFDGTETKDTVVNDNSANAESSPNIEEELNSTDVETQIAAIEILGQHGTDTIKNRLKQIATDDLNPRLRASAILASNWDGDTNALTQMIINETEPDVKVAIVTAINSAELNMEDRLTLEGLFYDSLSSEMDSEVINRILSYFYVQDQEQLIEAYRILLSGDLPPGVYEQMLDLAKGAPYLFEYFPTLTENS